MTMSDRVAVMNDGQMEQVGPPAEVYDEPGSEFVGEFIGQPTMEFFDATVERVNGEVTFDIGDSSYSVPATDSLESYAGKPVRIGIRPQHITAREGETGSIPADHVFDEPLGDQTHSLFETPLGRLTVVTPPKFRGNGGGYSLELEESQLKVFDPDSGVRIA